MTDTKRTAARFSSGATTSRLTKSRLSTELAAACKFVMATCQQGAEAALKAEVARRWPSFRFAFSRPGFVTFKLPENHDLGEDAGLDSVFARATSLSLGHAQGDSPEERARDVWRLAGDIPVRALHVWQRDLAVAGYRGYEPGPTTTAQEVYGVILDQRPTEMATFAGNADGRAEMGQLVLDCVVVEPDAWWVGFHRVCSNTSQWPGGLRTIELPIHAVSRSYLKMVEAMRWLGMSLRPGQVVTEFGCSPGGSAQAMLDRGLRVIGVDPADVDPVVLASPNFTHIRRHGADVRRSMLRDTQLLVSDMIVAPETTLKTIEAIVTHRSVTIPGLLLTLKLIDWKMAADIPMYIKRVRGWGYSDVRVRQLQYNRQEICLAAVKQEETER